MNTHISTKLSTIILIILTVTVAVFAWRYIKRNDQIVSQPQNVGVPPKTGSEKESQAEQNESDNQWKMYKNESLGFVFDYPIKWGGVIVGNNNKSEIETPPCETPVMMSYLQKLYPWGLYTASLKFSKAPVDLDIFVLDLSTLDIPKKVCNSEGKTITISAIKPAVQENNVSIINKSGITFISDPSLSTSINTVLEGPTYLTRHNNKLVWIYSGFTPQYDTPEEIELRKYTDAPACQGANYYDTEKGCGIVAWAKNGTTSEKIRKSFDDLEKLVQSFTFKQ